MALAEVADVVRIFRLRDEDPDRDEEIRKALETAESWALKKLRADYSASTASTATYYDINEDALLELPHDECVVSEVRIFAVAGSTGTVLSSSSYSLEHGQYVRLRADLTVVPFEGATGTRRPTQWAKVEIDFTPSGVVPAAVRDGVAMLAGGLWRAGPLVASGLASERLGDYSYSIGRGQDGAASYYDDAMKLLSPFLKKRKVMVT